MTRLVELSRVRQSRQTFPGGSLDSGLILQFWLEMIGWGFPLGFLPGVFLQKMKPLRLLTAAALPVFLYLILETVRSGVEMWVDPEIAIVGLVLLVMGGTTALPTLFLSIWLGRRARRLFVRSGPG